MSTDADREPQTREPIRIGSFRHPPGARPGAVEVAPFGATIATAPPGESALPIRRRLFETLIDPRRPGNLQRRFDSAIGLLIVLNLFALLLEHVPQIYLPYQALFHYFDVFSVAVFTGEYLLRLYVAPEDPEFRGRRHPRLAFFRSPFAVVDLLAVAPFYLQALLPLDLRALRFLRLLRMLKLFRLLVPAWKEFRELNHGRTFRQQVHALLYPSEYGGTLNTVADVFIAIWVVVSVVAVVLETVQSVDYLLHVEFIILDTVAVVVFVIEYSARLYCCVESPRFAGAMRGRLRHARTVPMVIDLLAILPFFLEALLHHVVDLRFLRVFRLLRLLKLTRYTGATTTLAKVLVREWPVMAAAAFIMLLLVIITASLGYLFEHEAQPDKFENIPQAIYWAVITLASVGYGDISPVTPMGRAITIVLALIGIGIFAIPAALLSSAFTDQLRKEREALKQELYEMLADGVLSADEMDAVHREAKRLHLTADDVRVLVEQARREREFKKDAARLPLHVVAANPEHAIEHYKSLLGEIRQLSIMTDRARFLEVAAAADLLSGAELRMWRQLTGTDAAEPRSG